MSYEKKEWKNGDVITADLLNHMEEGIAGGFGYSLSEQVVFDDSVTTVKETEGDTFAFVDITLSGPLSDTIEVEFNGTTYTTTYMVAPVSDKLYGAPIDPNTGDYDWSQYPFVIRSDVNGYCNINTQTAGTYTFKITSSTITVTDEFKAAVQAVMSEGGGNSGGSGGGNNPLT